MFLVDLVLQVLTLARRDDTVRNEILSIGSVLHEDKRVVAHFDLVELAGENSRPNDLGFIFRKIHTPAIFTLVYFEVQEKRSNSLFHAWHTTSCHNANAAVDCYASILQMESIELMLIVLHLKRPLHFLFHLAINLHRVHTLQIHDTDFDV